VNRRLPLPTILTVTVALLSASVAHAQDLSLKGRSIYEPSRGTPLFAAATQAAQAAVTTSTTPAINHQFGVGVRLGGIDFGLGASARYFFYGGPLGVQAELAHSGIEIPGEDDLSTVRFSPSVLYRFVEHKFNGPVSLTPYAGGGLTFVHTNFDEEVFGPGQDDTSLGVLLYGGVELFFENVPHLGVSGELTYNSNDDVSASGFGSASIGGVAFTAAGHWYFW
jgi:hypothetical protein